MHGHSAPKRDCLHCQRDSVAFRHILEETDDFFVVCDVHPLREGHLLIIPREHHSCVGALTSQLYDAFEQLYTKWTGVLRTMYGSVSSFEHGVVGQTVFHCHVHLLPCEPDPLAIVPEGQHLLQSLQSIRDVRTLFAHDGGYLFFSIGDRQWAVDTSIGAPRFFRDRFATALGVPERGDWKAMEQSEELSLQAAEDLTQFRERYELLSS